MKLTNLLFFHISVCVLFLSCDKDSEGTCDSLIGVWCRVYEPNDNACDTELHLNSNGTIEVGGIPTVFGEFWESKGCNELSLFYNGAEPFSVSSFNYDIIRVSTDTLEIKIGFIPESELYSRQ